MVVSHQHFSPDTLLAALHFGVDMSPSLSQTVCHGAYVSGLRRCGPPLSLVTVVAQGIMLCDGVRTHWFITAADVILILVCKAVLRVFAAYAVADPEA